MKVAFVVVRNLSLFMHKLAVLITYVQLSCTHATRNRRLCTVQVQ